MTGKSKTRRARETVRSAIENRGNIRVIGGRLRGRRLAVPRGWALRPTPNRVRETLFNWLQNEITGARCLDLFAGTGALGIEALSRGAAAVTFVESDARIAAELRLQLERLHLTAPVMCTAADRFLAATSDRFDIIFADPPFDMDAAPVCRAAAALLGSGGALYCERDVGDRLPELEQASWIRDARAGAVRFGLAKAHERD